MIKADKTAADRVLKAACRTAVTLIREGRDPERLLASACVAVSPLLGDEVEAARLDDPWRPGNPAWQQISDGERGAFDWPVGGASA